MCHNVWAHALEPESRNYQACWVSAATTEAQEPRARAPQQDKPAQREAHTLKQSGPCLLQAEKGSAKQWRPSAAKQQQ